MKLPFFLTDDASAQAGFAPGALALPTVRQDIVFVVGALPDWSRVMVNPEAFRVLSGNRLVLANMKAMSLTGAFTCIDADLPTLAPYIDRMIAAYDKDKKVDEETIRRILRRPLEQLRRSISAMIGEGLLQSALVPGELRVINKALEYLGQGRRDHARLFLQWPAFCQTFLDFPEIIDRSVRGESMWDLMPHGFDDATVRELRRMRKFSTTWVSPGVPTETYLKVLAKACGLLPEGAQRPVDAREAASLVNMSSLCDQAFRSLGPKMQAVVKRGLFAHQETWRGNAEPFDPQYAYDFVHFIYHNLLTDAFRLNGIRDPSDEAAVKAFFAIVGNNLQKIAEASKHWHSRIAQVRSFNTGLPSKWPEMISTLKVPDFRTVEGDAFTNVYIVPLDTEEELAREGVTQHHCAHSQTRLCAEGELRIVSVRHMIEDEDRHPRLKTLSTASFHFEDGMLVVRDHRAFANAEPSYAAREAIGWFEGQVNGGRPSFDFNRQWKTPDVVEATPDLRSALAGRFEQYRPILSKKMKAGGFDALLEVCK